MPSKRKTIRRLIQTAHFSLKEIYDTQPDISDFALGQIYAYLECLEILQGCPAFRNLGKDYDIEKRFPLPEK